MPTNKADRYKGIGSPSNDALNQAKEPNQIATNTP